jgi:hypothetical protein
MTTTTVTHPDYQPGDPRTPCKLTVYGKGDRLWGECACTVGDRGHVWCWLGTHELPRARRAKLRIAYAEHVARVKAGHMG